MQLESLVLVLSEELSLLVVLQFGVLDCLSSTLSLLLLSSLVLLDLQLSLLLLESGVPVLMYFSRLVFSDRRLPVLDRSILCQLQQPAPPKLKKFMVMTIIIIM